MTIERAAEVILKSRFMGYLSREAIGLHRKRETVEWQQAMHAAQALSDAGLLAGGWRPIAEAPKDKVVLLFGLLDPHPSERGKYACLDRPRRVCGYWDEIDGAWCTVGSTWEGPWFKPTAWQPLPLPPAEG